MKGRYDILPVAQRKLLPALGAVRGAGYVLYGGTAVALRLGHWRSIDFDFFCADPLGEGRLIDALPILGDAVPLQRALETWTVQVRAPSRGARPVKLSFFGNLRFGASARPSRPTGANSSWLRRSISSATN